MERQEVLLAEDEALIRILVEEALSEAGYAVVPADDGHEALQELNSPDQAFVGVVTDIRMPGASGWDVAHHARKLRPDIVIIYLSADSQPDWAANGVPDSIFIQKPFAAAQVVAALSTALNKSS